MTDRHGVRRGSRSFARRELDEQRSSALLEATWMDENRFDDLARGIGRTATRRSALRLLATGAFGALPMLPGSDDVSAACVPLGNKCDKRKDRCCFEGKCKRGRCRC